VCKVSEVAGTGVRQVAVGSCTNSSYSDLMTVAAMLKGNKVHPEVSMGVSPGSKQVIQMIARDSGLASIIEAGARILENACGPCIGMGFAPPSGAVTLRTFNRNFIGRSGTRDAQVYLCSPEVATASAIKGVITDPRELGDPPVIRAPGEFKVDDSHILPPSEEPDSVEVIRGPNIQPLPLKSPLEDEIKGQVLLKVEDNITTDHIMPAGSKVLPLRSNIPAISEFVFNIVDPTFPRRAKEAGGGMVVGGENYGQGSSREHAALAPMYLGLKMVLAKSLARIHKANLINFGILPLTLAEPGDYDKLEQGDVLMIEKVKDQLQQGDSLTVSNETKGYRFTAVHGLTERQKEIVLAGGLLNYTKQKATG
jgi:aconitate hydratase